MFTTLLIFLIILSIMVLVHELGHFFVAKRAGIKIEEFGFGLPPRIWGKKYGETIYSINALPIGGFVRMHGEEEGDISAKDKDRMFLFKPKATRFAVIIAGVTMNFILAVLVFGFVYAKLGIPVDTNKVKIVEIAPNSPAELSGLKVGDIVASVNNEKIDSTKNFMSITDRFAGEVVALSVVRDGNNISINLTPRKTPPAGEGPMGVAISQTEIMFYPLWKQIPLGIVEGVKEAFNWISIISSSLVTMVTQVAGGNVPKDVAGPIGIFQVTGTVAKAGIYSLLQFLGILSINLAVINILPLPALDGGRALFIIIEAVTKKRVKAEIEQKIHAVGMAFLLLLIFLITLNDISRIVQTSGILDKIKALLPV